MSAHITPNRTYQNISALQRDIESRLDRAEREQTIGTNGEVFAWSRVGVPRYAGNQTKKERLNFLAKHLVFDTNTTRLW